MKGRCRMFNNVGRKIAAISQFVFYLTAILIIFATILMLSSYKAVYISNSGYVDYLTKAPYNSFVEHTSNGVYYSILIVPLIATVLILALYISTLFFVGFGELIDNVSILSKDKRQTIEKETVSSVKNHLQGIDMDWYIGDNFYLKCPACGQKAPIGYIITNRVCPSCGNRADKKS